MPAGFASPVSAPVHIVSSVDDDGSTRAEAVVVVGQDEPVFAGHYPGFPIFPGVCVIECVHRASLSVLSDTNGELELAAVESARFLGPTGPGDELRMELTAVRDADAWRTNALVRTDRGPVAKVRLRHRPVTTAPVPPVLSTQDSAVGGGISFAGLHRVLPHRYPMLLVDEVSELVAGQRLTARKAVSGNEPWYANPPENAVPERFAYPDVLVLESWCQAAGVLATWDEPNPDVLSGQVMLFGSVSDVRLNRHVLPGDVLEHRIRVSRVLSDAMVFEGEALAAGQVVMSVGRATMAFRPAEQLRPAALAGQD